MIQDSIVGEALPAPLGALYRDLMSPYCPGLSLASCPSPQADSLRDVIAGRYERGESPEMITTALVADFGPGIRGSPTLDGFGSMAFAMPVLMMAVGAFVIFRWLRRNRETAPRGNTGAIVFLLCSFTATQIGCSDREQPAPAVTSAQVSREVDLAPAPPRASGAWVRAGAAEATIGGYATLHNPTSVALEIVGASSPASDTVEIHETVNNDGMVGMEARRSLTVPAGDSVQLQPGGLHFMIRRLGSTLTAGDSITLRLLLANGDTILTKAEVRPVGAR